MNRRNLLGGAAAASLAAGGTPTSAGMFVPAAADPDAHLAALEARHAATLAAFHAHAETGWDDPVDDALYADAVAAFEAILAAQPTTLAGLAVKARVCLAESRKLDGGEMEPEQSGDAVARSIVHDLLRLAGAGA